MNDSVRLADAISQIDFACLPPDVVDAVQRSLLDAVGVSLAGGGIGEGCAEFADLAVADGGRAESSIFGWGARVPAAAAAFANGAFAHALDFGDSLDSASVHPSAQVVPAVVALAEAMDCAGSRLVTAIAVGCDITCRLGAAVGIRMSQRGFYTPPMLGSIGATAACANLLGLSCAQTLDAISLTVSQYAAVAEMKNSNGSVIRAIRDAFAAQSAVRSAQLAQRGIRGFETPLEGRAGFFTAYAGGEYDADALTAGLGETFASPAISYKPWPACRWTHPFIEATLRVRGGLDVDTIERIELLGPARCEVLVQPRAAKCRPTRSIDAKFSLPFIVATALVRGEVTLGAFLGDALTRPDVLAVARLVDFVADDSMTAASGVPGAVTIRMRNGATVTHEVREARGGPRAPMTADELRAKYVDCAAYARQPKDALAAGRDAETLLHIHRLAAVREPLAAVLGSPGSECGRAGLTATDPR